jgi:hypothetical protein
MGLLQQPSLILRVRLSCPARLRHPILGPTVMWPFLAVGTAVFYALNGAWSVRVSRQIGAVEGAWALFAFATPFMGVYLLSRGLPDVDAAFWPAWIVTVVGNCARVVPVLLFLAVG